MGTVHGVYLKYVGLSAVSYAGLSYFTKNADGSRNSVWELLGHASKSLFMAGAMPTDRALAGTHSTSLWRSLPALVLGYSTILNGLIAMLFKMERGMGLIGKDPKTGRIPTWSYVVFFPFHGPTLLYTYLHKLKDTRYHDFVQKDGISLRKHKVPVATEVQPGWWVGGCYGHELDKDWAAVIDLTVEFSETARTRAYLSLPTWDGVPATPAQLEKAANFAVRASADGDVLVHCAHGRGRSTTIMCACLVKAGLFATWEEAFEQGIKPQRSVCKLNGRMRQNLTAWQDLYVDDRFKKGQ